MKLLNFARGLGALPFLALEWLAYKLAELFEAISDVILGK